MELSLTKNDPQEKRKILEIMHKVANQLLDVTEEHEIFQILSNAISQLLPDVFIIITKIQTEDMSFRITDNKGFDKYFDTIKKLLGKDPYSMSFPYQDLTEEQQREFENRKIYHFSGGIYDLVHGRIPHWVCKSIEKLLNIAEVYAMGFSVEEKYFGGTVLFITESIAESGALNDDVKLAIEDITNQSSTLIQRLRDRNSLKKKEDVLSNTNQQIETLIENSSSGYLFEDASRKILKVNKAFGRIFEIPNPEVIIGSDCKIVCQNNAILFSDSDGYLKDIERLFEKNQTYFNQELLMKDGRVLERDFVPIVNSTITGYLWQFRDITIRKQNEIKLKEQADLLHQINHAKDNFFTIIAHDLKGPFGAILGMTDMLAQEYDHLAEEERKNCINLLNSSSNSAYKLVENLLEWARLQRGHIEIKREKINLHEIINESIETSLPMATKKDITVIRNIGKNIIFTADNNSIKTIIRNLFNNSIKYTPIGGFIEFTTHFNEGNIEVSIKDSGIGMSQDTISKLFRIEKSQSRLGTNNETGTGLGLILCKDILEKNYGKIYVESELGKGSIFKFSIPVN